MSPASFTKGSAASPSCVGRSHMRVLPSVPRLVLSSFGWHASQAAQIILERGSVVVAVH